MAKEHSTLHVEENLYSADEVRFDYLDGENFGSELEERIAFLSGRPELGRKS